VGTTIFPGSPSGAVEEVPPEDELAVEPEFELELDVEPGLGFCAQGGRSGLSCVNADPVNSSAETVSSAGTHERRGVINIEI
jgi:hypothetical protein